MTTAHPFPRLRLLLTHLFLAGLAGILPQLAAAADPATPSHKPLRTRWADSVNPANVLPEYPRPQMIRKTWVNLNGPWDYALAGLAATNPPTEFSAKILVPFPYESALSGVAKPSAPDQRIWYRRQFRPPAYPKDGRLLLHFGAVNWDATVWVNGHCLGGHRGGYDSFSFDLTDHLKMGVNEIVVSAWNPVRADVAEAQVLGKQRLHPGGIFYTAASGIWQTVWLEPVPAGHITDIRITPDLDHSLAQVLVTAETPGRVVLTANDLGRPLVSVTGEVGQAISLPLTNVIPWTPSDPHLYGLRAVVLQPDGQPRDKVESYFGMRSIRLGRDEKGRQRMLLNGKFVFETGPLDQGYWPDGIYTAPTDEALISDISVVKQLGWNTIRKHAKVEPARWYWWTDRMGLLVWQDMPQMFGGRDGALTPAAKTQFETEWQRLLHEFAHFPSIIVWTTFNEGWGQYDTERLVALTKQIDPTRLVNNASGWVDQKCGDLYDAHDYPGPGGKAPEANRASVNGEFGGVTVSVEGHRWTTDTFGYGSVLKGSWLATKRYQALWKKAYQLRDELGISAFIYTQLTDVEQEINGLLTYDRAVEKLDRRIVRAAHLGEFPPLPPDPHPDWLPTSEDEPVTWSYTTNAPAANWSAPDFDAGTWPTGPATFGHDIAGVRTPWTGADIWIRREFTAATPIPAKLNLLLKHDEDAEIYINGVLAAKVTGYNGDYQPFPLSEAARAALHPGKNLLAAHCHNTIGGQGIDVGLTQP